MTTFPKNVYSVGHFKYQNETYAFASGDGSNLDVFKLGDLKQSGFTGECFFFALLRTQRLACFDANRPDPLKSVKLQVLSNSVRFQISGDSIFAGR